MPCALRRMRSLALWSTCGEGRTRRWSPYSRWRSCAGLPQTSGTVEEEEKGRKVEQEIERESQGEENAQMTMHMEMRRRRKLLELEPQCMCVRMM